MTKKTLFADTVLRKDGDQLYLMNRQEGGFRSFGIPIESEGALLAQYDVWLGKWDRDEHGAFCPVIRVVGSKPPTLDHYPLNGATEKEAFKALVEDGITHSGLTALRDGYEPCFGVGAPLLNDPRDPEASAFKVMKMTPELRGKVDRAMAARGLELVPYVVAGKVVREDSWDEIRARSLGGMSRAQALGASIYEGGALEGKCPHPVTPGLKQFIDAHPGVRVAKGEGPFYVALMPNGEALEVDHDGTVVVEDDGEDSKSSFVEDTDWDAISDALGPDD